MSTKTLNNQFLYIPTSALIASLVLHCGIIFTLLGVQVLDHMGIHLFPRTIITKDPYQSFIQVDVVGLPDQLVNDKSATDMSQPVVENPKVETEVPPQVVPEKDAMTLQDKLKQEAKEKEDLLAKKKEKEKEKAKEKEKEREAKKERLAEQEKALKTLNEEARREQALKGLQAKAGKTGRAKLSGNILSKGTATAGIIGTAKDRYTALLIEAIKQHYNVYFWQRKGLTADVYLELYPTGRVRQRKIVKGSADATFDSAVLQAIDEAQPLPVPEDLSILSEGISIKFIP